MINNFWKPITVIALMAGSGVIVGHGHDLIGIPFGMLGGFLFGRWYKIKEKK